MFKISIEAERFSNGKAKSFRRGVADALLKECNEKDSSHKTHKATYKKGYTFGQKLKEQIKKLEDS